MKKPTMPKLFDVSIMGTCCSLTRTSNHEHSQTSFVVRTIAILWEHSMSIILRRYGYLMAMRRSVRCYTTTPTPSLSPTVVQSSTPSTQSTPSTTMAKPKSDEEVLAEQEAARWFPRWFRRLFGWSLVVVLGSSAIIGIHQWQEKKRTPVR